MSYTQVNKLEIESHNKTREISRLINIINIYQNKINELINNINECINIRKENEILKKENDKIRDSYRCIVCYENCRNVIIEPCLHFACCDKCTDTLPECPICRGPCTSRLLVFGV